MSLDLFAAADDWRHCTRPRPWGQQAFRAILYADAAIVEMLDRGGQWITVTNPETRDEVLRALGGGA